MIAVGCMAAARLSGRVRRGPARGDVPVGDGTVPGSQAAVVPQTCTTAGAVRVVMPRGACENGCLDLILWSR